MTKTVILGMLRRALAAALVLGWAAGSVAISQDVLSAEGDEAGSSFRAVMARSTASVGAAATGADGEQRLYHMGLLDDYRCTGRVYDEPRRWRMKCAHNPRRLMPCRCKSATSTSPLVTCDCGTPVSSMSGITTPFEALETPALINAVSLPDPKIVPKS